MKVLALILGMLGLSFGAAAGGFAPYFADSATAVTVLSHSQCGIIGTAGYICITPSGAVVSVKANVTGGSGLSAIYGRLGIKVASGDTAYLDSVSKDILDSLRLRSLSPASFVKTTSNNWLTTGGVAFTDLSGSATCAQLPALTGDITSSAGSCSTALALSYVKGINPGLGGIYWDSASGSSGRYASVPISKGGTGQTTASTAFNALSPLTTQGDLLYGGASGAGTRLGLGTTGYYLTAGATAPVWAVLPSYIPAATNLTGLAPVAIGGSTLAADTVKLTLCGSNQIYKTTNAGTGWECDTLLAGGGILITHKALGITWTVDSTAYLKVADTNLFVRQAVLANSGTTHQFVTSFSAHGAPSLAQPAFTDISGSVAAAQLPNPSASTLGGVQSIAAVTHDFLTSISTAGVPAQARPACADLSDAAASCNTVPTTVSGNAGTATALATGRTIAITGDLAYTSPSFDGSGNVTAAGTLATVNSNVGTYGDATHVAQVTVNGKGLTTAASSVAITPAFTSITGRPDIAVHLYFPVTGTQANDTGIGTELWFSSPVAGVIDSVRTVTMGSSCTATFRLNRGVVASNAILDTDMVNVGTGTAFGLTSHVAESMTPASWTTTVVNLQSWLRMWVHSTNCTVAMEVIVWIKPN